MGSDNAREDAPDDYLFSFRNSASISGHLVLITAAAERPQGVTPHLLSDGPKLRLFQPGRPGSSRISLPARDYRVWSFKSSQMSQSSSIEWTNSTWNPVTGCTKVSQGCKHCYAQRFAERFRGVPGHPFEQGFDLKIWPDRLELPLGWREPRRIFVNSMSDLYHEKVPQAFIRQVFDTMVAARQHTFQILTKRAKRLGELGRTLPWRPNIWQGVSIENMDVAWRADELRKVPAEVRFLSLEPLLGPLDDLDLTGIQWVIVGGESGPGARPMEKGWVTSLRDRCRRQAVPFFFKQWGGTRKHETGRCLDGKTWDQFPSSRRSRTVVV
jgi:protein gp37